MEKEGALSDFDGCWHLKTTKGVSDAPDEPLFRWPEKTFSKWKLRR